MVHLPASGLLFTGDVMMPYLGAPFWAEGSPEGLLETLRLIRDLQPRLLIHGHTPLTEVFTIEAINGLEAALTELHGVVLDAIRDGLTAAGCAAALDLLAGEAEEPFVRAATTLIGQGDHALALDIITPGLLRHPASTALAGLRQTALHRLMERYQQTDPFRFLIYAELAGAEIGPVQ